MSTLTQPIAPAQPTPVQVDRYIGLVRVSTDDQGESRLGLEAGHADLARHVAANGGKLITTLEEVESGTHDDLTDRPTLLKALALCRRHRATLLVPKVDRLVRSTQVAADVKRSGVPFRACDNPHANEFTIDILVAVAAQEARAIGDRTRRALAVYKSERRVSKRLHKLYPAGVPEEIIEARAGKLGSDLVGCHLTDEHRAKGRRKAAAKRRREALEVYADLTPDILRWRAAGESLRTIADRLNLDGQTTRTGVGWGPVQVRRAILRASEKQTA